MQSSLNQTNLAGPARTALRFALALAPAVLLLARLLARLPLPSNTYTVTLAGCPPASPGRVDRTALRGISSGHRQAPPRTSAASRRHLSRANVLPASAFLLALASAEFVTAYVDPRAGVGMHVLLLLALLSLGVMRQSGTEQSFYLVLCLAPLIRIVSLTMPLGQFPQPYWYLLTAVPVFAGGFQLMHMLHISPGSLGLRLPRWSGLPVQLLVAATGTGLGLTEWTILHVKPIVSGSSVAWIVGASVILVVFTGFFEEFVFRGLIQHLASRFAGPTAGILFTSLTFAIMHVGWHSPLDMLFVFGVALYFGFVVKMTGTLLGVTLCHGLINAMLFVVLPLELYRGLGHLG